MMNRHEFIHIAALIHGEARRALQKLPAVYVPERKLMMEIKDLIEMFDIKPELMLREEEKNVGNYQ